MPSPPSEFLPEDDAPEPEEPQPEILALTIASEANTRLDGVKGHKPITTEAEYLWAANAMRDNATFIAEAKERFRPVIARAQAALNAVRELLNDAIGPAVEELEVLKKLRAGYEYRVAEERKRVLAATPPFPKAGQEDIITLPPPAPPKAEGVSKRKTVTVTVEDEAKAVAAAVAERKLVLLSLDVATVKKFASMYPDFTLPGVTITHGAQDIVRRKKEA